MRRRWTGHCAARKHPQSDLATARAPLRKLAIRFQPSFSLCPQRERCRVSFRCSAAALPRNPRSDCALKGERACSLAFVPTALLLFRLIFQQSDAPRRLPRGRESVPLMVSNEVGGWGTPRVLCCRVRAAPARTCFAPYCARIFRRALFGLSLGRRRNCARLAFVPASLHQHLSCPPPPALGTDGEDNVARFAERDP